MSILFPGWTLSEIRSMTVKEALDFGERAKRRKPETLQEVVQEF